MNFWSPPTIHYFYETRVVGVRQEGAQGMYKHHLDFPALSLIFTTHIVAHVQSRQEVMSHNTLIFFVQAATFGIYG